MDTILIVLLIIFIGALVFGYLIIYRQVSSVKKGDFKIRDKLQCLIFAFIFSISIQVVVGMAFIFTIETPDFWKNSKNPPPDFNPILFLIPFIICLSYISLYPLVDFLYIALSEEPGKGLTPFHKIIGEKIILRSNYKIINVIIAICLYFGVFVFPLILFSFLGVPFILALISWALIYPLIILTFYGSKGYIAGISDAYYHIPDIRRSIFLGFENGKRTIEEFKKGWVNRILLGLMLFVYVWAWISMIQTITFYFLRVLFISPYSYAGLIFVTLVLGIISFFSRFWGRKVTYRGIDVYFAAYLMAAIGINILVNFLLVNYAKLTKTFNLWEFTNQIVPNYYSFSWAAAMEEMFLISFISYYFLSKNNKFMENIKISKITQCGQTFDPIPLFNFIKNKNSHIRSHAIETLLMMYERIPLKDNINLNDIKYKNPLIDGLCDPNPYSKETCFKILVQLEENIPDVVLPWIVEGLISPNYDKVYPFATSLILANVALIEKIPINLILNLIEDFEWRIRLLGIKIFSKLVDKNEKLVSKLNIYKLLNDFDSKIQVETLNILAKISYSLPSDLLIKKINHFNQYIKSAAIENIKNLKIGSIDFSFISKMKELMTDPNSSVRASVFDIFSKIGNFKKNSISIQLFLEGLTDINENVRKASVLALERYISEEPESLDVDQIINKIDPNNYEILKNLFTLLGKLWDKNPEKILGTFLDSITLGDEQLKENISEILIEKSKINSELIINHLIKIPDVIKFIAKGIISRTLIEIAKNDPKNIIPKLMNFLNSKDDDIRLNAIETLEGLIGDFHNYIDVKPFVEHLEKDKNQQVKKKVCRIISKMALMNPLSIQPEISKVLKTLNSQEQSVKITLSKSIIEIAEKNPDIVPLEPIFSFFSDEDSFIRESGAKILGFIGHKSTEVSINILINQGLKDDDWIVRDASISSLGEIIEHVENPENIIKKLIELLKDKNIWVRRSAMIILSNIKSIKGSDIPFKLVKNNVGHKDANVREASTGLLRIYGLQDIDKVLDLILLLLGDNSEDVRDKMINESISIINNIGLKRLLSNLLKNLSIESSIELQRSIALLLEKTTKYESEQIRKRVIFLLKTRCEMSQDPIICGVLHRMKEF